MAACVSCGISTTRNRLVKLQPGLARYDSHGQCRRCAAGRRYGTRYDIDPVVVQRVVSGQPLRQKLTTGEVRESIKLLHRHRPEMTASQISARIGVSTRTVQRYRKFS